MKNIPTYNEYKNSGIEWIGKIPKEWKVKRLKFIAEIETGGKDTINREDDGQYPFFVRSQEVERINSYSYEGEAILTAGDGVGVGRVFHYINGKFDFHQRVYKISDFKEIVGRYLFYYIKENFPKEILRHNAKSTVDSLRRPTFLNFPVVFGDKLTQQNIADYLDEKTLKIEKVIKNKQKQIEILKEYERIIINKAITLGLNKAIELKKSNYPWIYELNSKWNERKLQYIAYIKGRIGWQGLTTEEYLDEGEYFLITGTDFNKNEVDWTTCHYVEKARYDEDKYIQLKKDDVLITKDGSIGKIMQITNLPKPTTLNSGIMVTRPIKNDYKQRFFFWVLKSYAFNEFIEFNKTGSTIVHLYQRVFNNFYFPVPSLSEQQNIADYLDEKTSKIRKSIELIEMEVEKLEEYKKILINDAVTGKIKVF